MKIELSNTQINLLMDSISDAMQYARERQAYDPEYQEKKNEYYKLYHEISNIIEKENT